MTNSEKLLDSSDIQMVVGVCFLRPKGMRLLTGATDLDVGLWALLVGSVSGPVICEWRLMLSLPLDLYIFMQAEQLTYSFKQAN